MTNSAEDSPESFWGYSRFDSESVRQLIHSRGKKVPSPVSCSFDRRRGADGGGIDGRQVGGAVLWQFALCVDSRAHDYRSGLDARLLHWRTNRKKRSVRNNALRCSPNFGGARPGIAIDRFDGHRAYKGNGSDRRDLRYVHARAASADALFRDRGPDGGELDVFTGRNRRQDGGNGLFHVHIRRNSGDVFPGTLFHPCRRPQMVRDCHRPGVDCVAYYLHREEGVWRGPKSGEIVGRPPRRTRGWRCDSNPQEIGSQIEAGINDPGQPAAVMPVPKVLR